MHRNMPHCDTLNGPVVLAAKKALETGNIHYILIWVPESAEYELQKAFQKTLQVRKLSAAAKDLADFWFFETAVRLHRAGEGEGFDGLKPDGQENEFIRQAEHAIQTGNAEEIINILQRTVGHVLAERFSAVLQHKDYGVDDVTEGRKYIDAYIRFVVYAYHLHESLVNGHLDEKSHKEH